MTCPEGAPKICTIRACKSAFSEPVWNSTWKVWVATCDFSGTTSKGHRRASTHVAIHRDAGSWVQSSCLSRTVQQWVADGWVPEEPALVPHAAHTHSAPHTVHGDPGVDDKPSGAVGMVAGLLHIDPRKAPGVQKDAEADVESIGRCTPASCVGRSKQTAGGHEPAELPPLKKRKEAIETSTSGSGSTSASASSSENPNSEVSPAKVGVPGADFPDKSKQCRGKANFGGKVTSLPHCAVCTVLRHHEFHGNICLLCEQTMRARNQRAWRKLSEEDRKSIAAESQRKRAESLSDEDAKKVAIISEQVRLLLFGR